MDVIAEGAALSDEELVEGLVEHFGQMATLHGAIVVALGEAGRRQLYRAEGATSTEAWVVERFGVAASSARALTRLAEKAWDIPQLLGALCAGEVSLDKVRAVAEVATPETDRALCDQAKGCTVRQLADIAAAQHAAAADAAAQTSPGRRSLRFNEQCRTMSVQLAPESFAEARSCLEARAKAVPSDGETPWDQRLCDAFMEIVRSSATPDAEARPTGTPTTQSPYFVVVHTPLAALTDEQGALAAELERGGLIGASTLRQITCDATMAIAVDDDVGHTMYEGRARRTPSDAQRREVMRRDRHCRFPGCANVTFTNTHHIEPWQPGGTTDLDNLALLCVHHHHVVHSKGWEMTGDANEELTFVGPTGRVMVTRPSPLWTMVSSRR